MNASVSDGAALLVTRLDKERLSSLLSTRVGLAYRSEASRLRGELRRANVIAPESAPADLVTMNSTVVCEDDRGRAKEITLVYPWRQHEGGVVSVLSNVGMALLGRRVGDTCAELRIVALRYQPEAAGHWHL